MQFARSPFASLFPLCGVPLCEPPLYQLADERLSRGDAPEADIELLLGASAIWQIIKNRQTSAYGMCAQESALGWLLIGQDQEAKKASQNLILARTSVLKTDDNNDNFKTVLKKEEDMATRPTKRLAFFSVAGRAIVTVTAARAMVKTSFADDG